MAEENKKVTVFIDGKEFQADPGKMIIQVADDEEIPIPRFCYHDKLSIAANCRMCLVEIEGGPPKPMPACATPIAEGMKVKTRSQMARDAQRSVMEFLLINHPLDCPVCDQGGECELQDFSYQYGQQLSLYEEAKRHYQPNDIGPLVETYMNRCIHCTRCVRFGAEIAGIRELGAMNRGDRMHITTHVEHELESEISANIIDLCPVGALTDKVAKHKARPWEYDNHSSLSIHDGLGTNTTIHTLRGSITRVVPRVNQAINENWIADRDRFSYQAIHSNDRALEPYIRDKTERLVKTDWMDALVKTRMSLEGAISAYGVGQVGILVSPSATLEEMYLAKQLTEGLGIDNLDHRLNQDDFRNDRFETTYRSLGVKISEVNQLDSITLIGADLRMELPILAIRMRDAVKRGAKTTLLSSYEADQLIPSSAHTMRYPEKKDYPMTSIIRHPSQWIEELGAVLKAVATEKSLSVDETLLALAGDLSPEGETLVAQLVEGKKQWLVLGHEATRHPDFALIQALAVALAKVSGASLGYITDGANASGASLTKILPTNGGLNSRAMIEANLKAYVLVGALEPYYDYYDSRKIKEALKKAEAVIALTPFYGEDIKEVADILLPVAAWGETPGSLMNLEGKVQTVSAASLPKGEARPLWKVLRVLGNQFELAGFDYVNSGEVLQAWHKVVAVKNEDNLHPINIEGYERRLAHDEVLVIPSQSLYSVDSFVRRSEALQKTPLAKKKRVVVNPSVSALQAQDTYMMNGEQLTVKVTDKVAYNVVRMPIEYAANLAFYSSELTKEML